MKKANKEYRSASAHQSFPDRQTGTDRLGRSLLNRGAVRCVLEDENAE